MKVFLMISLTKSNQLGLWSVLERVAAGKSTCTRLVSVLSQMYPLYPVSEKVGVLVYQ